MKRILILSMILLTGVTFVPAADASAVNNGITGNNAAPQIRIQLGGGRRYRRYNRYRRVRTTTTTRISGWGRNRYRETIRTTYWPNGRVTTQVLSRDRYYRG